MKKTIIIFIQIDASSLFFKMGISAFLIVKNGEKRIAQALDSIWWVDEKIVVDSGSVDQTVAICKQKGAQVFSRTFDHFAAQKNYALSLTTQEWVFSLDSDEVLTPSLAEEIKQTIKSQTGMVGYYINRRNYFLGKPLRFGRQGKEPQLRLFLKGKGKFVGMVHETVQPTGTVGFLKGVMEHYGTESLKEYFVKLHFYTDLEAKRMIIENRPPALTKTILSPLMKWLLEFFIYGGILDGRAGFLYHSLSCYYGWVKNLKARQLLRATTTKKIIFKK